MKKIVFVGIGGVGGYYGGLMAKHYAESQEIGIVFYARGKHLEVIQQKGLRVEHNDSHFTAHPFLATHDAEEIGTADFIILCTKGYDLENTLEELRPCIGKETCIVPLLNGVSARELILQIYPDTAVSHGCTYILSAIKEAGVIENFGTIQKVFFGLDSEDIALFEPLASYMKAAQVEAMCISNILPIIWQKYIFISVSATASSFHNMSIQQVAKHHETDVKAMLSEAYNVGKALGVDIDESITSICYERFIGLPSDTTASMHRDFMKNPQRTEVEELTGEIVRLGDRLHIETPVYHRMYQALRER